MDMELDVVSTEEWAKTLLHLCFCMVLGWTNSIMMFRFRIFATMMVGNTILMGVSLACQEGLVVTPDEIKLCPAEFPPRYYAELILLFVCGAFFHGLMEKAHGWTPRAFAPMIVLVIVVEEIRERCFGSSSTSAHDDKYYAYLLAPIFGVTGSISMKCGLQGVPWAASGNMLSAAYHFAHYLQGFAAEDLKKALIPFGMWVFFFIGVFLGNSHHSRFSLICISVALALLFLAMSVVLPKKKRQLGPAFADP
ncbi:unnamed protein product [Symbiodinium natans]|uniref:Uncharacterized protein n=1 Tax=Symbiodinium natans TaxID=878477 RepID=A0A812RCS7_9DINO|nr:unnamed protein product [Symbiodinium natans]